MVENDLTKENKMDSKIKEQIDNIFKKHPGNTICLDLYGNIDYGDRAQEEWWPERIEDFSNELKLEQTYGEIKMNKIIFANLGVEDSAITDEDIDEIGKLCGDISKVLKWETRDFDGEVNEYWYGLVVVTNDYKVLRITSTGHCDALYRTIIGDLTKMGDQNEEAEKLALDDIKESVKEIKEKLKDVKSDKGKEKVKKLIESIK